MRLLGMRKFSKMSSDIVYQMSLFTDLFKSTPDKVEVIAAKAKKDEITKRCAKEQTDVDKEITAAEAEAKVQPVAKDAAVKEDKGTSLFGAPVTEAGPGADTKTNSNPFSEFSQEVKPVGEVKPAEGSSNGGKSKKKKGGKSNKKKFSKKRKGGKRAKSQKKRR